MSRWLESSIEAVIGGAAACKLAGLGKAEFKQRFGKRGLAQLVLVDLFGKGWETGFRSNVLAQDTAATVAMMRPLQLWLLKT